MSLPVNNALAGRLLVAGRVDEALGQLRKTLEMDPHFAPAHQTLGWAYLNQGKHEQAIQEFQQALQLSGNESTDLTLDLGFAYAAAGKREEARGILAKLKQQHEKGLVPSGHVAILYGALGDSMKLSPGWKRLIRSAILNLHTSTCPAGGSNRCAVTRASESYSFAWAWPTESFRRRWASAFPTKQTVPC